MVEPPLLPEALVNRRLISSSSRDRRCWRAVGARLTHL
jgi:hypothetical protein